MKSEKSLCRAIPNCPLCGKKMRVDSNDKMEIFFSCIQPSCMVSINAVDPNIELWKNYHPESDKELICEHCGGDMNFFFRADEYFKSLCQNKRCQASVESHVLPDRTVYLKEGGEVLDGN
jgi:hypothetical protein